jgi:hypothetical protein
MLQGGRSQVRFPNRTWNFSITLILEVTIFLWDRQPGIFLRVKGGWNIRVTN